jgi:hypothetical protein
MAPVIGELIAATCEDPSVLSRIGGSIGDAARDASSELAVMSPADARTWRARLIAAVRAPIPPGLRGVHGSWIEAGLDGLPARVREALAGSARDPIDVWLVRWACAEIPPLPPVDPALVAPREIEDAPKLSADALVGWLANLGADQLAYALRGKPDALQAIAGNLGRDGDRVVGAVRRITAPPRAGSLGTTRDAIARCRGDAGADLLLVIGARTIAPYTDPMLRRQLVVRLPRPRGLRVLAELRAHAGDPLDRAPAWDALSTA